jgi:hypothetical protein
VSADESMTLRRNGILRRIGIPLGNKFNAIRTVDRVFDHTMGIGVTPDCLFIRVEANDIAIPNIRGIGFLDEDVGTLRNGIPHTAADDIHNGIPKEIRYFPSELSRDNADHGNRNGHRHSPPEHNGCFSENSDDFLGSVHFFNL